MVTLEQVEKLCEKASITYDEAKAILEETNGDILEAIIRLEKQGRIQPPKGGGYYNSREAGQSAEDNDKKKREKAKVKDTNGTSFGELVGKFFRWCGKIINKGNMNYFEVTKDGETIMNVPVTVLTVLLLFMFWITIPLIIIGLFFGYRYFFTGPDLGKENVNKAMDTMANAAENIKKEVKDHKDEKNNGENSDN